LARIGLVIVTQQVKHAMKHENPDLILEGPSESARVTAGDRWSDGDISEVGIPGGRETGPKSSPAWA
jgi:hypothetical protein